MFNFKELLALVVLIFVLGIAGFLYRNAMERPTFGGPHATTTACTLEAKVCPDGESVGRVGPTCAFAPCPPPNVELPSVGISFVLPEGYAPIATSSLANPAIVAAYETTAPTEASTTAIITISRYPIPEGKTAAQVILSETILDPSGLSPQSLQKFASTTLGGSTFLQIQIGRFEGQVRTAYYLPRAHDALRFDVIERNVTNWTSPALSVGDLPGHRAIRTLLSTLQVRTQ
ncbi:MAG TPA: hypothetical protein VF829_00050 [Candidatus Paceibacterota bacterium]